MIDKNKKLCTTVLVLVVVSSILARRRKEEEQVNNKRAFLVLETVLFEKLLLDSGIDKTNDVVDVVLDFLSTKKRIISCDFFPFILFANTMADFCNFSLKRR